MHRNRKIRKLLMKCMIILIGCFISFQMFVYLTQVQADTKYISRTMNFSNTNILMYMKPKNSDQLGDGIEMIEETIDGDRNIFFIETSHIKNKSKIFLNSRQGCAIESAALMNPTMNIYLLIFSSQSWNYSEITKNIIAKFLKYENIFIRHLSTKTYFMNTPVERWWNTTNFLSSSHWFSSHMSDVLRYLTLWKFGGIYIDLDVVTKSSLEHLKNFAGIEDLWAISSAVIGFDLTKTGRRYADECLMDCTMNFHGDRWAYNGPGVITRILTKICNTIFFSRMTPERCDGFEVLSRSAFYPIHYSDWEKYFNIAYKDSTMKTIENSLAIHVWNKLSQSKDIQVGTGVPYELIARQYCPKIYENVDNTF